MLSDFLRLGIDHILDIEGADHMLFLVAMVIIYSYKEWKEVILLATAFTVGHSITLVSSAIGIVDLPSNWVEIFIAITIAIMALSNFKISVASGFSRVKYVIALLFGMIHGLGFAGHFKSLFGEESFIVPLIGFNLGGEIAQVVIVLAVLFMSAILTQVLGIKKKHLTISVSAIIFIYSLKLIIERL